MRLCEKAGSKTKPRQGPCGASGSQFPHPFRTVGHRSPASFLLSLPLPPPALPDARPSWTQWPFCRRAERSAVSHGVERRCGEAQSIGEASGTQRGHLHYKLAVIKPLLTIMGSFQSEVMPATADNTGDSHRSPAGCNNTGSPLCDRFKLSHSSKSPFSSTTGYTSP